MSKRFFSLLAALTLFFTVGCEQEIPEYSYTEEYISVMEPYCFGWILEGTVTKAVTDSSVYYFTKNLSESARNSFISAQEELCKVLEKHDIPTDGMKFYVLEDYENHANSAQMTAYVSSDTAGTWEQILTTLQTALGEYTNYGYLYALSDQMAKDLGWVRDSEYASDFAVFGENPALLNLVYPCFTGDPDEISACKALSKDILAAMDDPFCGEAVFLNAVLEYTDEHDIAFAPTSLEFTSGGRDVPLKIRTQYIEVFFDKTYSMDFHPYDSVLATTDGLINFFETLDARFAEFHDRFGVMKTELVPVHMSEYVPLLSGHAGELAGKFHSENGKSEITAKTISCLSHEYAHYLYYRCTNGDHPDTYEQWHNEVIANYFGLEQTFENRLRAIENSGAGEKYAELLGEPYDSAEDEIMFMHIANATMTENPLYELKTSHNASLSFGAYLAELYTEPVLIECMIDTSSAVPLTGKTVDELVDDWCAWLDGFR